MAPHCKFPSKFTHAFCSSSTCDCALNDTKIVRYVLSKRVVGTKKHYCFGREPSLHRSRLHLAHVIAYFETPNVVAIALHL